MKGAPLTVPEARAVLIADEALQFSFEQREAAGLLFGNAEREAWIKIVESATERVAAFDQRTGYTAKQLTDDDVADRIAAFNKLAGYTTERLTDEDVAEIAELLRVLLDGNLDDKLLLAWHGRLREIREKMVVRLGDVTEQERPS